MQKGRHKNRFEKFMSLQYIIFGIIYFLCSFGKCQEY